MVEGKPMIDLKPLTDSLTKLKEQFQMASKKDYEGIAFAIATELARRGVELSDDFECNRARASLRRLADTLASYFESDNPAFSRITFLQACGLL
jgi:hypothetical protein